MSPQARAKLPPELGRLTRKDMEAVIYQANLGRATVQRRLPEIMREMQRTSSKLYN